MELQIAPTQSITKLCRFSTFTAYRYRYSKKFDCRVAVRILAEGVLNSLNAKNHLKGQCHEMVVEMRLWSSRLGLN
jgi:hypothetical protein